MKISEEVADEMIAIAFDPQTSGGLLIAVPDRDAIRLVAALHGTGVAEACIAGRVSKPSGVAIELV